ncbi:MAG: hypothetical protein ACOYMN_20710 [Roseimicrobium sp.]
MRQTLALLVFSALSVAYGQALSPLAANITRQSTALGALSLSRQTLLPSSEPTAQTVPHAVSQLPRATYTKYPWKMDICATVFWVGELPTENNPTPNTKSSWDTSWTSTFGGYDDPDPANRAPDYRPAAFIPGENPFYVALPYNDCVDYRTTKPEAATVIPWFREKYERPGKSVCRNRWVAIRVSDKTCYAQWTDCGPFLTTDVDYVFGNSRPINAKNNGAGIDVSPSVRDFLGFRGSARVDWRFVDDWEVPEGPWKRYGNNNNSSKGVNVAANRLEELRRQRDEWFRQGGSSSLQRR